MQTNHMSIIKIIWTRLQ